MVLYWSDGKLLGMRHSILSHSSQVAAGPQGRAYCGGITGVEGILGMGLMYHMQESLLHCCCMAAIAQPFALKQAAGLAA